MVISNTNNYFPISLNQVKLAFQHKTNDAQCSKMTFYPQMLITGSLLANFRHKLVISIKNLVAQWTVISRSVYSPHLSSQPEILEVGESAESIHPP